MQEPSAVLIFAQCADSLLTTQYVFLLVGTMLWTWLFVHLLVYYLPEVGGGSPFEVPIDKQDCCCGQCHVPAISRTFRNPRMHYFTIAVFLSQLVLYEMCLYDAWMRVTFAIVALFLILVYFVNAGTPRTGLPEEKRRSLQKESMVHTVLAFLVFLCFGILDAFILVYYYIEPSSDGELTPVGIVFAVLLPVFLFILFVGALLSVCREMRQKKSSPWWESWVAVFEHLYAYILIAIITFVPTTELIS